jgi:hypothetical protein
MEMLFDLVIIKLSLILIDNKGHLDQINKISFYDDHPILIAIYKIIIINVNEIIVKIFHPLWKLLTYFT